MRKIGMYLVLVLGVVLQTNGESKKSAAPAPITLYADGLIGTPVTVSLAFDTTKFKLAGTPQASIAFSVKESYLPDPTKPGEAWIPCKVTATEAAANCGDGKANMFFSDEDGVKPWGQVFGTKWITTVRGQSGSAGQHWRARVAVKVVPVP